MNEDIFGNPARIVLRSEMLDLARRHPAYSLNPAYAQAVEQLPIIRLPDEVLASMVEKAHRLMERVRA